MKYAYSTLGCPRWGFTDIISTALDLGYDGVEIRGIADELYAPKIKVFEESVLEKNLKLLKGLEIPMLTTNACIAVDGQEENAAKEAIDYINLANKIGAKFIRVLSSNCAGLDNGNYELAKKSYRNICNIAKDYEITPLIETNGMFCDTELLKKFLKEVGVENCGVLWDIHHPYRYNNETIDQTIANIGEFIKYIHIKDSVVENSVTVYKMIGHGNIPIKEALRKINEIGYDGYITLEWVKRWNPNLEEPGVVFAQFIKEIKRIQK